MIIKVNFSPDNSATPNEFITDSGAGYSSEQGYGWITQNSLDSDNPIPIDINNNTRDRESNSDLLEDTLIHLQYPDNLVSPLAQTSVKIPAAWEYDLANGSYYVTVGVGDPDFTDSSHTVNIEGESAISDFVPTEDSLFAEATTLVEVTDGRLTIDAVGGDNTKLTFLEIVPESQFNGEDNNDSNNSSNENAGDESISNGNASQLTVGEFSIGLDESRINETNSGLFIADNADTGTILFDISDPGLLSIDNDRLTIAEADLLLSPEFANLLGDASLQGTDVGDTRIDAVSNTQDNVTFNVESGVTSVFLDLSLLESAAGFQLADINSETQPFNNDFPIGFGISEETDFIFNTEGDFVSISGELEHDGTVTFDTNTAIEGNTEEDDNTDGETIDSGDSNSETIRINYAPASAFEPEGYIQDIGREYSDEKGFGWITQDSARSDNPTPIDISPNTRDRNVVREQPFDSLIHLQYADAFDNPNSIKTPAAWEYELANGEYTVTVSVGDPDFTNSNHVINIEGNSIISGFVPTQDQLFAVETTTVEVTDGRLTIDAIGGDNTKLNFVEITPGNASGVSVPSTDVTPIELPTEVPISVEGGGVVETVEPIEGGINVNFGVATANLSSEFTQDVGAAYSDSKGYGWVTQDSARSDNPNPINVYANARDRDTLFNNGQGGVFQNSVRDSLIHMQYPLGLGNSDTAVTSPVAWEYALENGQYEVTVGVGDPDFFNSNHVINVEGESIISGFVPTGTAVNGFLPLDAQAFTTGTAVVEVTDGKLTVDAIGGENTKINYITIVEAENV